MSTTTDAADAAAAVAAAASIPLYYALHIYSIVCYTIQNQMFACKSGNILQFRILLLL